MEVGRGSTSVSAHFIDPVCAELEFSMDFGTVYHCIQFTFDFHTVYYIASEF